MRVGKRLNDMGYKLGEDVTDGKFVDELYEKLSKDKKYGARPISRLIQTMLEDKLATLLIENKYDKDYVFSCEDIYSV